MYRPELCNHIRICAHGAMCHYSATPESNISLEPRGLYLIDSGGQYYEGTTDITRTIAMGPVTDEEKEHFTLVLMSMLRLGDVKFLHGCRGLSLDYAAREPLWRRGLNYEHGTGHGVSYLSSVHERPNGIRFKMVPERQDNAVMEAGMITSDELACILMEATESGRRIWFCVLRTKRMNMASSCGLSI